MSNTISSQNVAKGTLGSRRLGKNRRYIYIQHIKSFEEDIVLGREMSHLIMRVKHQRRYA